MPVPAGPRQLKDARKAEEGPVFTWSKKKTPFLLSRDALQLRKAAKTQVKPVTHVNGGKNPRIMNKI